MRLRREVDLEASLCGHGRTGLSCGLLPGSTVPDAVPFHARFLVPSSDIARMIVPAVRAVCLILLVSSSPMVGIASQSESFGNLCKEY